MPLRGGASRRSATVEIVVPRPKVFAQRGYHGASTQDIADVLGIRQASLYYYFALQGSRSRSGVPRRRRGLRERTRRRLPRAARGRAPTRSRELVFHHWHRSPSARTTRSSSCASGASCRWPPASASAPSSAGYERPSSASSSRASTSGEFRADLDARMATLALLGLGNSAAAWYGREPGVTLERITRDYVDLLVRAFRKGAAPVFRLTH